MWKDETVIGIEIKKLSWDKEGELEEEGTDVLDEY